MYGRSASFGICSQATTTVPKMTVGDCSQVAEVSQGHLSLFPESCLWQLKVKALITVNEELVNTFTGAQSD